MKTNKQTRHDQTSGAEKWRASKWSPGRAPRQEPPNLATAQHVTRSHYHYCYFHYVRTAANGNDSITPSSSAIDRFLPAPGAHPVNSSITTLSWGGSTVAPPPSHSSTNSIRSPPPPPPPPPLNDPPPPSYCSTRLIAGYSPGIGPLMPLPTATLNQLLPLPSPV